MCSCENTNCCSANGPHKVEKLTLEDGRRAERHTSVDETGKEVVETFVEEMRPLKLEKRITRETKNIVAKEVHETVRDGEVVLQEVHSLEQDVPLQIQSRIGVADHHQLVNGDYVRKDEISKIVEDGVVAGIATLMEHMEPVVAPVVAVAPPVRRAAMEVVEKTVEDKKKKDLIINLVLGAIIILQLGFAAYVCLM